LVGFLVLAVHCTDDETSQKILRRKRATKQWRRSGILENAEAVIIFFQRKVRPE
jgi:hypothetical protein